MNAALSLLTHACDPSAFTLTEELSRTFIEAAHFSEGQGGFRFLATRDRLVSLSYVPSLPNIPRVTLELP